MGSNNVPTIFVGDIVETLRHGDAVVLEYKNSNNITIQFRNTGHIQETTSGQIKTGMIRDRSVKQGSVNVGDVFHTNNCGTCVVLEYRGAKEVLVRFHRSGIEKVFSTSQLRAGTTSDKYQRKMRVGDKFETTSSGVATIVELLPKGEAKVVFEDGNTKICKRGLLAVGCVFNGSWAYTQEEALAKLKSIWGDRYSYDKVMFKTVKEYITVTCNTHGDFEVTFDNHVGGCGCRQCGIQSRAEKKTLPESYFYDGAFSAHGGLYDYSKVVYKNNETEVEIICREHGSFWQKPEKHKAGQGCPVCAGNATMTTERFISIASKEHETTYGYSLIRDEHFEHESKLVPIICKEHGVFHQHYRNHLSGNGCNKCAKFGFKTSEAGTLYVIQCDDIVKVGVTNNEDISVRVKQVVKSSGKSFVLIKSYRMSGTDCLDAETSILRHLRSLYRNPSECFSGFTECFVDAPLEYVIDVVESNLKGLLYV